MVRSGTKRAVAGAAAILIVLAALVGCSAQQCVDHQGGSYTCTCTGEAKDGGSDVTIAIDYCQDSLADTQDNSDCYCGLSATNCSCHCQSTGGTCTVKGVRCS